jgi:hypothetical protein
VKADLRVAKVLDLLKITDVSDIEVEAVIDRE